MPHPFPYRRGSVLFLILSLLWPSLVGAQRKKLTLPPKATPAASPATTRVAGETPDQLAADLDKDKQDDAATQALIGPLTIAVGKAQTAAMDSLEKDATYLQLTTAASAALTDRDAVKESDTATAQDKVDAASVYGTAQSAVDQYKAHFLSADHALAVATAELAAAQGRKAAIEADAAIVADGIANPPAIKAAMAQHTLVVGMTVDQCNKSVGHPGRVTGSSGDDTDYEWGRIVQDSAGNQATITFEGVIRDGKLVDFSKLSQGMIGIHVSNPDPS